MFRRIDQFFNRAMYFAARGYEKAALAEHAPPTEHAFAATAR
jgi:hypothetical protein